MKVPTSPVLFAFVLLCLATMAEAKELVLVEREQSLAPIMVFENDESRLRFIVDGNLLMERLERSPAVGPGQDRFGLYFYTAAKVRNVRLYVKPLAADDI